MIWYGTGGTLSVAGFATNLREMGISDDVIQRILRHADIGTAQRHYAKTLPKPVRKAMSMLNRSLTAGKRRTSKRAAS